MRNIFLLVCNLFILHNIIAQASLCYNNGNVQTIPSMNNTKAINDLNNDGFLDIITTNMSPNRLCIYYGNNSANYSSSVTYTLTGLPSSINIVDINKDSIKDIVFTSRFAASGANGTMKGNVNNSFDVPIYFSADGDIVSISDFSGDSNEDLLIKKGLVTTLKLGDGNGLFTGNISIIPSTYVTNFFVLDLNNDGKLDLLANESVSNTGKFMVYMGNQSSVQNYFNVQQNYFEGSKTDLFTTGDFNIDGFMDVVSTSSLGITVFLNNTNGTFTSSAKYFSVYTDAKKITSNDYNNDGFLDLLIDYGPSFGSSNNPGGRLRLFTGNGDGTFTYASLYPEALNLGNSFSTDINGDGSLDVIGNYRGSICSLLGTGNGYFNTRNEYGGIYHTNEIVNVYDLNKDGYKDIILGNNSGEDISIIKGIGNAEFDVQVLYPTFGENDYTGVAVADFNQDGNKDIAVSSTDSLDRLSVYYSDLNGVLGVPTRFSKPRVSSAGHQKKPISGDFNQDGFLDIVYSDVIFVGSVSGITSQTFVINPMVLGTGDFNKDGKTDLVTYGHQYAIGVSYGNGNFTFTGNNFYGTGQTPSTIKVVDLNNDGNLDIITGNWDGVGISVLKGSNTGTFSAAVNYTTGSNPNELKTADFNQDGFIDVAVINYNSSAKSISILLGTLSGSLTTFTTIPVGSQPDDLDLGDFNSDGITDIVINAVNGQNAFLFYKGIGNGNFSYVNQIFIDSDVNDIALEDVNHDNIPEVISSSTAYLSVLYSGGPSISISGTSSICIGASNNLIASGASTYTWSTNENTSSITVNPLSTTIYTVIGTNSLGCQSATTKTVTVNPSLAPSLSINGNTVMCSGLATTFSVSGASTYTWSNGTNTSTLNYSPITNTVLTVKGTDINGCENTATVSLNVLPLPNVTLASNANSNCGIKQTTLSISGSTLNTVSWSTGATTQTIVVTPSITTSYSANVTGVNTCIGNLTKTITVLTTPTISISGPTVVCPGVTNTLIASGAYSYTWSGGGLPITTLPTKTIAIGSNSNFNIVAFAINGCSTTTTYSVNSYPNPTFMMNSPLVCSNSVTTFSVLGCSACNSYSWSTGAVTPIVQIAAISNGSISVTFNDVNTCPRYVSSNYIVYPTPTLNITAPANVCVGTSANLSVSGANTYTWSNSSTSTSITVIPTIGSTYSVSGKGLNNCVSTKTISVTVDNTCADVWPGDANSDGTANNLDVLELGLHYSQTGVPRASTSNSWQSYFSNNWTGTITNGKNLNHSDCNGDGTIDDNDTLAIYNNYGLTHAFKPVQTTTVNPQLSIVPDQTSLVKGSWGTASIYLGDAITSINNINGLAFTINFDNTLIETNSIYIEYQNSFLDAGQNLHFRKLDFANGKIFTATTHTINNNVSGNGLIAKLHYQIKSSLTTDEVLNIGLSQANQSNASGIIAPLTTGAGTLMALGSSVGIQELNGNIISISPNPTNGSLTINSKTELQKIEFVSITGQVLLSEVPTNVYHTLHLDSFANGIYFVNLYQDNRIVKREKIVLNK